MRTFQASTALILATFAVCSATAVPLFEEYSDLLGDDEPEGRIFTSNTNINFGFTNGTIDGRALLAAALIGLLFAVVLGSSLLGEETSGYGYAYNRNDQQQQQGYNSNNFYARSDKSAFDDLAAQMGQLAEAFKKYEVEEANCQLYVACEASQEARHEENGNLAREVFDIMRTLKKRGRQAVHDKDAQVAELLDAFVYGELRQHEVKDVCHKLRNKCYDASKKPAY